MIRNLEIKSNLIEAHLIRKVNNKIEYLLLKRSPDKKYPNIWQMVTGKIHSDEKAYETVVREIKEETGIKVSKLFVVPNVNHFYNDFDDSMNIIPVFVAEVNRDAEVKLSPEHCEYKWVGKKEAIRLLAWPGQATSVKIIHNYFAHKKENLNFVEIKI